MNTLYDLGMAITQIRDAADTLEVKGAKNAAVVAMIFQKCNDIINELNKIAEEYKEKAEEVEDEKKVTQVGESDASIS